MHFTISANDEIAQMKHELETIEEFIHQADKMADAEGDNPSEGTREKIKQLIEAFFRIQDVIDEYIIREEQQLPDPGCVDGASDYVKTKMLRLQIAHDIQVIKSKLNEIKDTTSKKDDEASSSYTTNQNATSLQNLRKAPFYMNEADVVGFEEPRKKLVDWLITGRTDLTVVSVVAMGGQGKTTLAKKVFDNNEVVKHFDCRVWFTVSQSYNIEELLRGLLKEICKQQKVKLPQNIHEMTQESLVDEVRNYLQEKRYVVVFDDVWNSNFWDHIKFSMIDKNKSCRILITTRKMEVANVCRTSSFVEIHKLECLTYEQSLELFYKKTFHDLNGRCPENLVHISSEIVRKCSGLPLAIVVIGGLLSSKDRETFEWYNFSKNINLELKESNIKIILGHSYHDLPYNLKSCLLYFGLYPEDCIVPSKILIQQWIAEGFVKEDRRRTLEEVAEGYFTELIRRSLVQVVSIRIDGRVESCRVHDLVHAMILEKCEDLSFCKNIFVDKQSSLTRMVRRLSIAIDCDNLVESVENSQVQSLFVYGYRILSKSHMKRIPTKYRRLKVLNLEIYHLHELPNDLGSLSHLKYLRLEMFPREYSLPKSIGMLSNLETLDLEHAMSIVLPKEICKLRKLRHLLGLDSTLTQLKDGIGGMTTLQTLSSFRIDNSVDENDNRELIEELGKLKQLRKLDLDSVMTKYISALCSSINEMQQLEELSITTCGNPYELTDMDLNSPPPMLRILTLDVNLEKFPKWISKLQNLVKLRVNIDCSQLEDGLKLLKGLPTLLSLEIFQHDYEDRYEMLQMLLNFQNGWFKNLKELCVEYFQALNYIFIDKGALSSLKKLHLHKLRNIKTLPSGIQHLENLESLTLVDMSMEFKETLISNEGKEHWIFKQVPHVVIK